MNAIKTVFASAAIAAATLLGPVAQANILSNGGFEDTGFTTPFSFTTINAGSTDLSGWVIEAGSVDLINNYWQPASGHFSLDLNGNSAATISQQFATTIGQTYIVSFDMAGNTDGAEDKNITVGVTGGYTFGFSVAGKSHSEMGWESKGFTFTADSELSTITFQGDSANTYYGAALDNISVSAVPEADSYAMLLAGLGLVGFIARRKKAAA
jgi:choice-of-anchor C domain-containing protein